MHLLFGTWFGWWFIAFVLYAVAIIVYGLRTQATMKDWLVKEQGHALSFRKPIALRRMGPLLCGVLLLRLIPILHQLIHPNETARRHMAHPLPQAGVLFLFVLSVLGLCLFMVYLAGPNDTRIDGDQRTFENTAGWPWSPQTRVGSLDNMQGVSVSSRNSVMLLPHKRSMLTIGYPLSGTGTKQAAQALAEKVSKVTGLPIVDYPRKS